MISTSFIVSLNPCERRMLCLVETFSCPGLSSTYHSPNICCLNPLIKLSPVLLINRLDGNTLPFIAAQKNQFMTQNGFTMYMLSRENDVVNPEHARVYQDMSHPLAHYFISSSHNTYLTKDQVTSASSTEPYIRYSDSSNTIKQHIF